MWTTASGEKEGHFAGFIYAVLRRHISDRINHRTHWSFVLSNSAETGKFRGSARNFAACGKLWPYTSCHELVVLVHFLAGIQTRL